MVASGAVALAQLPCAPCPDRGLAVPCPGGAPSGGFLPKYSTADGFVSSVSHSPLPTVV